MILFYKSLGVLINLIEFLILVRIIMSFLNISPNNSFVSFIYEMTEPVLSPARNLISKLGINTGMFDFSPIIAIFLLTTIYEILGRIIF
ncbi:YggT family protein [Wansuia hejianensis]|uniref:YggT family protein n=1 Tax=Wansuia hejianensis TaxID=2763667 RepID=A0A926F1Z0_9FIRM|nr:YggT family protein [Wansuia hejianensis]